MTEEVLPVPGTTTHLYNPHGESVSTTDARGITELRTVDALDRATFIDYPDDILGNTYTCDDPAVPFSLGRLTAITRSGHSVDYAHDRFGRMMQDGELTFTFDKNGNRTGIGYPGGVSATYDHDFADRETSLSVTTANGTTPHCLANCLITKRCPGGKTVAVMASLVKEAGDLGRCLIQRKGGNCDSAFQPDDFKDNETGRQCEPEVPCHVQCEDLRNRPEPPPGPFGGLNPDRGSSDASSGS